MQVDPSVFKAYDIRGVVGRGLDEDFAEHLGRAFGSEAIAQGDTHGEPQGHGQVERSEAVVRCGLVTPDMRERRGVWGEERTSPPVAESDIRRWAIAVYWPETPPRIS